MIDKVSIKNLNCENGKYSWNAVLVMDWEPEERKTIECETNNSGNGLFEWDEGDKEWRQVEGTFDFCLSGSISSVRSKLYRYFANHKF